MRINHNISAINTNRLLATNNGSTSKSLEKLSSGLAVNRAGDNAAGLAISEKMRGQIRGLNQASSNANDGISLIQTAEGGLNETHAILQRMRELAVQSANDTNTEADRAEIQKEVDQLTTEITRISTDTEFNTRKLLNGTLAASASVGAGAANGLSEAKVAAGANLTVSGDYTVTVSNYTAGTNHAASGIEASVETQSDLNTFASAAKTLTFDGTNWKDGENTVDIAAKGISVDGTPNEGDTLTITKYTAAVEAVDASDVSATGETSVTELKSTNWTHNGSKWIKDGSDPAVEKQNSDFTGLTFDGTAKNGTKMSIDADGKATFVQTEAVEAKDAVNATVTASSAAKTDGTETTYDVAITDANGAAVSTSAFDLSGINANGTATVTVNANSALTFHIGANSGQATKLTVQDMSASSLGVDGIDLTTQANADAAIGTIDNAINTVSAQRAALGAMQNRLEHTINNLGTSSENLSAAESQIRDVDMAEEMSEYTKNNILVQAATAMLAQANQQPQNTLSLLQ